MQVLPPVVDEGKLSPFKFWFSNSIQDGMYYHSELYYRLYTVDFNQRARLYHYACKLAQTETVAVTASDQTCSIWVSLRSPSAIALRNGHYPLPAFMEPVLDEGN